MLRRQYYTPFVDAHSCHRWFTFIIPNRISEPIRDLLHNTQLYGIQSHDPWIAVSTILVLAIVAAAAGMIPAHRASRIEPILALRFE
jgi:ABC-type lipoprotein release transport system permease subunit